MQIAAEILARREYEAEMRSVNDAEASARRKAWCAKVGRAIGEEIDDIAEMEEDRQYGLRRFRQQEEALRRREESTNTRNLRGGLFKAEKATSRPTQPPQPRAFRNALPGCAFVARTLATSLSQCKTGLCSGCCDATGQGIPFGRRIRSEASTSSVSLR